MHPTNSFSQKNHYNLKETNEWLEVSVCGAVFSLKENRLFTTGSPQSDDDSTVYSLIDDAELKSNVLRDGTLIDLCGATLMWRSMEGLQLTPNKSYLDMNLMYLNKSKPQCPVGLKTLRFPLNPMTNQQQQSSLMDQQEINKKECPVLSSEMMNNSKVLSTRHPYKRSTRTPMVYLKCGHVHGQHDWGVKKDNERECPLCRTVIIILFCQIILSIK
jgi:pellino